VRDRVKASKIIAAIGEKAGIITDAQEKRHATAHDLRRSFGHRWAGKVMPQTLKELMRHADISTTLAYYVGSRAEAIASDLWKTEKGNTLGNTSPADDSNGKQQSTQPAAATEL
jgi:integrase